MAERRFKAQPASPGLALGPLFRLAPSQEDGARRKGSNNQERAALDAAIARAMADLEALAAVASGDGADILAFQIEMLGDPTLIEDILPPIEQGEDAVTAWTSGLAEQIQAFEADDDDYFRARASDLQDLRDRVTRALKGQTMALPDLPPGGLLLASDLTPSQFLALAPKAPGGLALIHGSASSHVAILARGRGLPLIIGLDARVFEAAGNDGVEAVIDADCGELVLEPSEATAGQFREAKATAKVAAEQADRIRHQEARTADGQPIDVLINVDDPQAIDEATLEASDGVGLLRTEFLLIGREDLPSEQEHFQVYSDLLARLAGKPLIIRTLDIGGDKQHPGLDLPAETNPFLGLRGLRLCLDRPALFRPQIRALLAAAAAAAGGPLTATRGASAATDGSLSMAETPLRVMLPMVSTQAEIEEARGLFEAALQELQAEGVPARMPPLGIMVETPAAALAVDDLDAAFFSIGSNDLIQYVMAAARDAGGRVRKLLDPGHPAIERLIREVVDAGGAGREVSLCGDMASDPEWLPLLLRAGVRKLSVAPAALGRIKYELSRLDLSKNA